MQDSFNELIPEYISKEEFFRYGCEKTIYISDEKVKSEWKALKDKINGNKAVFMRSAGKSMSDNHLYFNFYKKLFNNENIKKDPSNTQNPSKIIEDLTGLKKSKDLKNYQVASIFGRSKNIFAFTAPWNIVYMPKILDALVANDSQDPLAIEYRAAFESYAYNKFKPYIEEFNDIVTNIHFTRGRDSYLTLLYDDKIHDREALVKFEDALHEEFAPITLKA
jgi:hypothetical protein